VATSTAVQVDHVVALGDAWQTGAQALTGGQRLAFANDPGNLLAVAGRVNEQKSDSDAASWLPPNRAFRCGYVARQLAVKRKYRLWLTPAEKAAIAGVLSSCPGQALPLVGARIIPAAPVTGPVQTTSPAAPPSPTAAPPAAGSVYYPNCAAVTAAGKAPLHRGDPGYRSGLDRDGDGLACE
jgi:hypothetical protein